MNVFSRMENGKFLAAATTVANLILLGAGGISLMAFFYSVYYYGWTEQRQFEGYAGMAVYYGVPALLATLLFACLMLKPRYRIILAICFVSTAASAYAFEILLFQYKPQKTTRSVSELAELARHSGVHFDTRSKLQMISDLRRQGIDAVPQINLVSRLEERQANGRRNNTNLSAVKVVPLAGIANKLTVACNQTGQYLLYKTDEHGFHNPKGLWRSRRIDIAAIGNSFTLGYCAPSAKNYVAVIRKRYPATLNLGMPGAGPLHILAILREYALSVRPKIVLWFYSEATFPELQHEKQNQTLMHYLKDDFIQGLRERQSEIDHALASDLGAQRQPYMNREPEAEQHHRITIDELPALIKLSNLRHKLGWVYGASPQQIDGLSESELSKLKPNLNLLRDSLSKAKVRVGAWGGGLYFVYLPSWQHYDAESRPVEVRARAQVLKLVADLGIPLIDAHPAFQAHNDPLSLFPFRRGHYNEEGHRVVAETVLNVISRRHPNEFQSADSTALVSEG